MADPLLRADGGRGGWDGSDGDGAGAAAVPAACCCCDKGFCDGDCAVAGEDDGALPPGAVPPADLLGTIDGLNREPPFSIRDDMV